jgi:hypothetical protein
MVRERAELEPVFNDWVYDRERPVGMSWSYPRDSVEAASLKDPAVVAFLGDIFGLRSWPEVRRCQGETKSGLPCTQGSLPFSTAPLCLGHSKDTIAADATNRQQCWEWWCITHGHLDLVGHRLYTSGSFRKAVVMAKAEWPAKYNRALVRVEDMKSRDRLDLPSPCGLAVRRLLGWQPPRLCGERTNEGLPCCALASRWVEQPACPVHYGDDAERAVFCQRFSAWMTWREAADPTVQHLYRPILPNWDPWFFGDVCPGATLSTGYHEGVTVTRRVEDVFGDLWLCESCGEAWQPITPSDLPSFVDVGHWEPPAQARRLRRAPSSYLRGSQEAVSVNTYAAP